MTEIEKRSYFEPNVCRLCSYAKDKVLPIFDTSGSKFDDKIKECFSCIKITPADGKPQQICFECITKLNIYYEFRQLCARSQALFDSVIDACVSKEAEERSRVEEVAEDWAPPEGEVALRKLDNRLSESVQDLLVVVELKYKDEASAPAPVEQQSLAPPEPPKSSPLFRFDADKKEYECAVCDKTFKKRTRLNSHLACHTNVRPHSCDQCGKSFAMRGDLNVHARIHKRDIVCTQCDKSFSTKSKLDRHVRSHTGEKPFGCNFCGRRFGDKRNLSNHSLVHSGLKPHTCAICGKTFSIRSHMVEHLNAHKRTASYTCSECNKVFRWRASYKKHLKKHLAPPNEVNLGEY